MLLSALFLNMIKSKYKGDEKMYKILIKYTSTASKTFWQSHEVINEDGESVEFNTDNVDVLKEELDKLAKLYGYEGLRVVTDIAYTVTIGMPNDLIDVISVEEVNELYNTAFANVFGGE